MSKVPRKKSKQVDGVKPTSAGKAIKSGAASVECRVSKKAVALAIPYVEEKIIELARSVSELLELSKKKKVTPQFLLVALKRNAAFKCQPGLKAAIQGAHEATKKSDRQPISIESGLRIFKQGLKTDQIMSGKAKVAVAKVIGVMLHNLGADAYIFTHNAGRNTIKEADIDAALKLRDRA